MSTRDMVIAGLFAALVAAGALVSIPLQPVPFTFQVLFVLMAGLLLRPQAAAAAMTAYLMLGIAGLPVFSSGQSGLGTLAGPTGGYLIGFVAAAVAVSLVAGPSSRRNRPVWRFAACLAGLAFIYGIGAVWLGAVAGLTVGKAVLVGVLPFLPLDLVKAGLAVAAAEALDRVPGLAFAEDEP